jgi:general L-amino acid transport system substrate-binding protein
LNLADYFRSHNIKYKPVAFADADEVVKAHNSGRCDVYTDDATGLYGERIKMAVPDDNVILPEIIAKEPLAPAVRQGDDKWFNVVRWSGYAMVQAEELGVTSKNADEMLKSDNPEIKRLLGVEGDFGKSLGLSNDWTYQIIKKVGNYGERFDADLGHGSPPKIKRGLNQLWTNGGLQYSPPIR